MISSALSKIERLGPEIKRKEISRIETIMDSCKTDDDLNKLILHHSKSQADTARACGLSLNTFKERVAEALSEGVINEVLFESNKWRFTLNHIHAMMDFCKVPKYSDQGKECIVINTQNHKGGTGKSTTAISIAVGIALRLQERRRVLLIDLDPQGSHRISVAPDIDKSNGILTAVDIMLGDVEKNSLYSKYIAKGYTHEQIVKGSILSTHIPNLEILPAFPDDERFSPEAWLDYAETGNLNYVNFLKDKVINVLKPYYDMIIIDTGPMINVLTASAQEACNALLVPVSPRKLDWSSTGQFLCNLPKHLKNLPSKAQNIKYFKVVVVNYDEELSRDLEMLDYIKDILGSDMLNSQIKKSTAFEAASRNYRTVYDLKKSDNLCPDKQLDKAIASLNDVIRELLLSLKDIDFKECEDA